MQVAISPCCRRDLPDVILRIFPRMPGPMPRRSHRLLVPVSSSVSSAFPWAAEDWLPASNRETTFPRKSFSRAADIPLRSSLRVCSPPRLFLPLCLRHRAAEAFRSNRAERASLPPHAPDMLTARIQAIDGTGTYTPLDSQLCRLLRGPPTSGPLSLKRIELSVTRSMKMARTKSCC